LYTVILEQVFEDNSPLEEKITILEHVVARIDTRHMQEMIEYHGRKKEKYNPLTIIDDPFQDVKDCKKAVNENGNLIKFIPMNL